MRNAEYQLSQLKHKLQSKKEEGKLYLLWKLSDEQVQYIRTIGYTVVPYLFEIQTKPMRVLNGKLVKEIHYSALRGRRTMVKVLSKSEEKFLKEVGIKHRVLKYKIYL